MSIIIKGITKDKFATLMIGEDVIKRYPDVIDGCGYFYGHEVWDIPPHGRLIDADALEEYCKRQVRDEWNQKAGTSWSYAFAEFENIVDDCDTIIEAEGVKE